MLLLAAINVIAVLSLLGWPFLAFGSVFLFDDPASERNPFLWATAYTVWYYYPVAPCAGNFLYWTTRGEVPLAESGYYTLLSVSAILALVLLVGMGAALQSVKERLLRKRD